MQKVLDSPDYSRRYSPRTFWCRCYSLRGDSVEGDSEVRRPRSVCLLNRRGSPMMSPIGGCAGVGHHRRHSATSGGLLRQGAAQARVGRVGAGVRPLAWRPTSAAHALPAPRGMHGARVTPACAARTLLPERCARRAPPRPPPAPDDLSLPLSFSADRFINAQRRALIEGTCRLQRHRRW